MKRLTLLSSGAGAVVLAAGLSVLALEPPFQEIPPAAAEPPKLPAAAPPGGEWTTAVDPKPLSEQTGKGLQWLVDHQGDDGGWGQGEESAQMRRGGNGQPQAAPSNVADTCMAVLALIRSGSTPAAGTYAESIRRGLEFVMGSIEASDSTSISITSVQGTRLQAKLGPSVDTFLASVVMPEARGHMPDEASEARLAEAHAKVLRKIEINQQGDGTWTRDGLNAGWAPVLARSWAVKGLNRAQQLGLTVDSAVLERARAAASSEVGGAGGGFGSGGSAGIALYSSASNLSALQDTANSDVQVVDALEEEAESGESPEVRTRAARQLEVIRAAEVDRSSMQEAIIERLGDERFVAGFGSNGGEEFLSYVNIGESLVVRGGDDWKTWDESMTANMVRIQNQDGSWTGHHCITGRTFCTAAALLVMMVDRTPVPVEAVGVNENADKP